MVAGDWAEGEMRSHCFIGMEFEFGKMEKSYGHVWVVVVVGP